LQRARFLIASSPFVYEAVGNRTKARFYDVENCLDEEFFGQKKDYNTNHSLVYVGYVIRDKGVIHLVRAVHHLIGEFPQIKLKVVGTFSAFERDYELELRSYVKDNGLEGSVSFEGFVTGERKLQLMNEAAILVHPSRLETFCLSVAEAMALGTPVVATRVGGLPYTVGGEQNAILTDFGSSEQLASAIASLFRSAERRRELGTRARESAKKRFHPSVVIPELVGVYEDVVRQW
jgi:glycosyltransferase involved in cell wall biosynthesis